MFDISSHDRNLQNVMVHLAVAIQVFVSSVNEFSLTL